MKSLFSGKAHNSRRDATLKHNPIVLFDGVCNFCSSWVNFILKRDKDAKFLFASIQSEAGRLLLHRMGLESNPLDTLILRDGEDVSTRSTAALRILKQLKGWNAASILLLVPSPVRDSIYDIIAKNRYRWFGRTEVCRVPTALERDRFIETLDDLHAHNA